MFSEFRRDPDYLPVSPDSNLYAERAEIALGAKH